MPTNNSKLSTTESSKPCEIPHNLRKCCEQSVCTVVESHFVAAAQKFPRHEFVCHPSGLRVALRVRVALRSYLVFPIGLHVSHWRQISYQSTGLKLALSPSALTRPTTSHAADPSEAVPAMNRALNRRSRFRLAFSSNGPTLQKPSLTGWSKHKLRRDCTPSAVHPLRS